MSSPGKSGCSVEGCEAPHIARGYCQNHYRMFRKHGSPTPPKAKPKVHTATGGYKFVMVGGKVKYLHIIVAEKALGRPLPPGAEVHHVNGDPSDNSPENLVICPDHKYHMLIHQRERALAATGNPEHRPCRICGQHDAIENMAPHRNQFYHRACMAEASRATRAAARKQTEKQV